MFAVAICTAAVLFAVTMRTVRAKVVIISKAGKGSLNVLSSFELAFGRIFVSDVVASSVVFQLKSRGLDSRRVVTRVPRRSGVEVGVRVVRRMRIGI
jgi:hypothetical protein